MSTHLSHSEEETRLFARDLGRRIKVPAFVCLYGNLGSGKTVFAKGLAEAFGIHRNKIKSPTYTFVRQYREGKVLFYHFDFYRIEAADDLMRHDLEDIFSRRNAIIVMEWPEHIENLLPKKRINVKFDYIDADTRSIMLNHDGK